MLTPTDTPIGPVYDHAFIGETLWWWASIPDPPDGILFQEQNDGEKGRAYVPDARRFSLDDGTQVYESSSLSSKGRKLSDDDLIRLSQGIYDNDPVTVGVDNFEPRHGLLRRVIKFYFPEPRKILGQFACIKPEPDYKPFIGTYGEAYLNAPPFDGSPFFSWPFPSIEGAPSGTDDENRTEYDGGFYYHPDCYIFYKTDTNDPENQEEWREVRGLLPSWGMGADPDVPHWREDDKRYVPIVPNYLMDTALINIDCRSLAFVYYTGALCGSVNISAFYLWGKKLNLNKSPIQFTDSAGVPLLRDPNFGTVKQLEEKTWGVDALSNLTTALYVKNVSSDRAGDGVVVALDDHPQGHSADFQLSLDQVEWFTELNLGSMGAGSIVGPIYVRFKPGKTHVLGLGSPRLRLLTRGTS